MQVPPHTFGLDDEIVKRDYAASYGFGLAYGESIKPGVPEARQQDLQIAAASSFRRAGASAMLLGRRDLMEEAFGRAGNIYFGMGRPYFVAMNALAGRLDFQYLPASIDLNLFLSLGASREELLYLTLAAQLPGSRFSDREIDAGDSFEPPGTLGVFELSADIYRNLIAVMRAWRLPQAGGFVVHFDVSGGRTADASYDDALTNALTPFVTAYDHGVRLASRRRDKWPLLVQRMHPAEPDILCVLRMVDMVFGSGTVMRLLPRLPMSDFGRQLLQSCLSIFGGLAPNTESRGQGGSGGFSGRENWSEGFAQAGG